MGNLVFQAALGGQVALSGPNTASSFTVAVPAVSGTMVTTGDTGTVTSTMISGPLTPAVGGTGVNNGSNTLSLAGNVSHTGAYTQTIVATANTSVTLPTSGTIISSSTALGGAVTGTPSSSTYLRGDGTWAAAGTVTSVGLSAPSFLSVSGSPVSSSGTLALSYSGTALPVANGGTGLTSPGTSGNVLTSNGSAWVSSTPSSGMTNLGTLSDNTAFSIPSGYSYYLLIFQTGNNSTSIPQLTFNGYTSFYNYKGYSAGSAATFGSSSSSAINLTSFSTGVNWCGHFYFGTKIGSVFGHGLIGSNGGQDMTMVSFNNVNISSLSTVTLNIPGTSSSFSATLYGLT